MKLKRSGGEKMVMSFKAVLNKMITTKEWRLERKSVEK